MAPRWRHCLPDFCEDREDLKTATKCFQINADEQLLIGMTLMSLRLTFFINFKFALAE
jgi:hypothetical protein